MAHHSSQEMPEEFRRPTPTPNPELLKAFESLTRMDREAAKLAAGATGRFPEGKLHDTDEGELAIVVSQKDGKVVIDFGKPTAWIGFTAEQSEDLGRLLIEHGREIRLRR